MPLQRRYSEMTFPIDVKSEIPSVFNVTMTLADTEYSQELPYHCKKFTIKTRDLSEFRLAFVTGKVATPTAPWITVNSNMWWWEDGINNEFPTGSLITLYFASDSAGKIIELLAWV